MILTLNEGLYSKVRSANLCHVFDRASRYIDGGYFLFLVKDRNSFHRVDTIGNIFTSGAATRENITDGVHSMK